MPKRRGLRTSYLLGLRAASISGPGGPAGFGSPPESHRSLLLANTLMRTKPVSLLLLALACLGFNGCSSFTPPDTTAEETGAKWELAQEKDSTVVITLVRDMSTAQVQKYLGKPLRTRVPRKATEPTLEWTYRRYVLGGYKVTSGNSRTNGQFTAQQRIIYTETLELTFVSDKLVRVKTSRIREDTEAAESITPRL